MLDRIALMANWEKLPTDLRKLASHVGGIRPGTDGSDPQCYDKTQWPDWADPGNQAYKAMVDELLGEARSSGKPLATGPWPLGIIIWQRWQRKRLVIVLKPHLEGRLQQVGSFPSGLPLTIYHG